MFILLLAYAVFTKCKTNWAFLELALQWKRLSASRPMRKHLKVNTPCFCTNIVISLWLILWRALTHIEEVFKGEMMATISVRGTWGRQEGHAWNGRAMMFAAQLVFEMQLHAPLVWYASLISYFRAPVRLFQCFSVAHSMVMSSFSLFLSRATDNKPLSLHNYLRTEFRHYL